MIPNFLCVGSSEFWYLHCGSWDKISLGSGWLALLSAEHLAPSRYVVLALGNKCSVNSTMGCCVCTDVGQWNCIMSMFFEANSSCYPTQLHLNNGVASEYLIHFWIKLNGKLCSRSTYGTSLVQIPHPKLSMMWLMGSLGTASLLYRFVPRKLTSLSGW